MDFPKSVPGVGLVGGKFVDENQATGQVGSLIPAKWGNDVTTELLGVIEEADLVPDEEDPAQLRAAVRAIVDKVAPVASKAEAETNDEATADNVKRMTPLRVFQAIKARMISATEAVVGMLRVGTQAEVNAGGLNTVAVTPLKLKGAGGLAFANALFHVRDERPSGTAGGTFTSGAWRTRPLNTVSLNQIAGASLASNQITLPPGDYLVLARATAAGYCGTHATQLFSVTTGAVVLPGSASRNPTSNAQTSSDSWVQGRFTLAAISVLELQHRCQSTQTGYGLGDPGGYGAPEVFADVMIWRLN